jgi:hypothetical protein
MINSLETGGTERQFVEVARSLRNGGLRVQLGCLIRRGSFLEGLGEVYHSPLGGSLYGLRSLQSRWQLMRYLRKSDAVVAHSFDFYANLMLIPAAKLARVPVVIGSHRQLGDLLTPNQFVTGLCVTRARRQIDWQRRVCRNASSSWSAMACRRARARRLLPHCRVVREFCGLA